MEFIKSNSSLIAMLVNSNIFFPPTVTARASGLSLAPLHLGQGLSLIYFSISAFMVSELVSIYLLLKLFISPSKEWLYTAVTFSFVYVTFNFSGSPYIKTSWTFLGKSLYGVSKSKLYFSIKALRTQ